MHKLTDELNNHFLDKMKVVPLVGLILLHLFISSLISPCDAASNPSKYSVTISSSSRISKAYVRGVRVKGRFSTSARIQVPLSACLIAVELSGGSHTFALSNDMCDVISSSSTIRCTQKLGRQRRSWFRRRLKLNGKQWTSPVQTRTNNPSNGICANAFWVTPRTSKKRRVWCRITLKRNGGWSAWSPQDCSSNGEQPTRSCSNPFAECGGSYCSGPSTKECTGTFAEVATELRYDNLTAADGTQNVTEYLCTQVSELIELKNPDVTVADNCTVTYFNGSLIAVVKIFIQSNLISISNQLFTIAIQAIVADVRTGPLSRLLLPFYVVGKSVTSVTIDKAQCLYECDKNFTTQGCSSFCYGCTYGPSSSGRECVDCDFGYDVDSDGTCKVTTLSPTTTARSTVSGQTSQQTAGFQTTQTYLSATTARNCDAAGCAVFDPTQTSVCTSCNNYYYRSGQCCEQCPAQCAVCNNSITCNGPCNPGFSLNSQAICQACPADRNCDLCETNTTCAKCAISYFLNNMTLSCDACLDHCVRCENSLECLECEVPYVIRNGSCAACPQYCSVCTEDLSCISCEQTFYLAANGTCQSCDDINCLECNNATSCTRCDTSYYGDINNECAKCGDNCAQCDASTCEICNPGFYSTDGWNCTECSPYCYICANETFCLGCIPSYYSGDNGQCQSCPDENCKLCIRESNTLPDGSTAANITCNECKDGFYLSDNLTCRVIIVPTTANTATTTVARTTTTEMFTGTTETVTVQPLCPIGCGIYNPMTGYCTSCDSGFYNNGTCCSACQLNCLQCTNSTNCIGACQPPYSLTTEQTCINCSVADCKQCISETVCALCFPAFIVENTGKCAKCPSNCLTCYNSTTCTSCDISYGLSSTGVCIGCSDSCSLCTNGLCDVCKPGFYLANDRNCLVCPDNCTTCTNETFCNSCSVSNTDPQNYYLDSNNKCSACPLYCLSCNGTYCDRCISGFHLTENFTCSACESSCYDCSGDSICNTCFDGFYLANNTCYPCSLPGCKVCPNDACETCPDGNPPSNGVCLCFDHCDSCLNATACGQCSQSIDQSQNYYLNASLGCSECVLNCYDCDQNRCHQCVPEYFLNADGSNCTQCSDAIANCSSCSIDDASNPSVLICSTCDDGLYRSLDSTLCLTCESVIPNCESCTDDISGTTCNSCSSGFVYDSPTSCLPVQIETTAVQTETETTAVQTQTETTAVQTETTTSA